MLFALYSRLPPLEGPNVCMQYSMSAGPLFYQVHGAPAAVPALDLRLLIFLIQWIT